MRKSLQTLFVLLIALFFAFLTVPGEAESAPDIIEADDFAVLDDHLLIRKGHAYTLRGPDGNMVALTNPSTLQPVLIDGFGIDWNTVAAIYQPGLENTNALAWLKIAELDPEAAAYLSDCQDIVLLNGSLYLTVPNDERMASDVYQYSILNQSLHKMPMPGVSAIAFYDESHILVACHDLQNQKYQFYIWHAATNERLMWGEMDSAPLDQIQGLTYDSAAECAYFVLGGRVYRWIKDQAPSVIGYRSAEASLTSAAITSNGTYWLHAGRDLKAYSPQASAQSRTLTIAGEYYASGMNPKFAQKYPEIAVNILKDETFTMDQMLSGLATRQATADILILKVSSGLYSAMVKKGFCADLSKSEALSRFTQTLYPVFSQWTAPNGALLAVPTEMLPEMLIGVNEPLMNELGITKPDTYQALLALHSNWESINAGHSDVYTLYDSPFAVGRRWILGDFTNLYIASMPEEEPLNFESPLYLDMLTYLDHNHEPPQTDSMNSQEDEILLVHSYPLLPSDNDSPILRTDFTALPLRLDADHDAVIPASLILMAVNAASPNQDIAIKYLECLVENYPVQSQVMFVDKPIAPVENESYSDNIQYYSNLKEEISAKMAQAKPEERPELEALLEDTELAIAENESLRWLLSPDDIQKYKTLIPAIRILPGISYSYFSSLPNLQMTLFEYENEETTAEIFMKKLNSVQRMINKEQE